MILPDSVDDEVALRELIFTARCCVLFVGAGIVTPPGKSWQLLVEKIAERCGVTSKDAEPLPEVIDRCSKKSRLHKCNTAFREEFQTHTAITRTALTYLNRLPFKSLLTTNFDPWIRLQSRYAHYENTYSYPDLPLTDRGISKALYYLHGYFDQDKPDFSVADLVFGKKSFEVAYRDSLLPGFLLNVFTYENVLFVGFNPTEENIARILIASRDLRTRLKITTGSDHAAKHFILWPVKNDMSGEEMAREAKSVEALRSLGITPVKYEKKDDDFKGLEEVIYPWLTQGDMNERSAPFRTGFDPPTEIHSKVTK